MVKVLICTVGGQPQPVVNAVRQNAPLDRVYFLCSTGAGESGSDLTIEKATTRKISGRCPRCNKDYTATTKVRPIAEIADLSRERYTIERIDDPDDLVQVVRACERIEADVGQRWPQESVEVVANYTGGTKTMSLGLGFYALRRGRPWWLQVNRTGERDNVVRVETGDVALPQDVSYLLAEAASERAAALAERYDDAGAEAVVEAVLIHERLRPEDQKRLLALRLRSALRAAWDRLDYRQALDLARQNRDLAAEHAGPLSRLLKIAALVEGDGAGPRQSPAWSSSQTCAPTPTGPPPAAVTTTPSAASTAPPSSWRRSSCAATTICGPTTSMPAIPRFHPRPGLEGHRSASGAVKIGLVTAYELLAAMGDPLGAYFAVNQGPLLNVIEKRNHSLFAYGLTPIDRETWDTVGPRWQGWLEGAQEACG